MSKNITDILKAETLETPSAVAFRKVDTRGNTVAVTRISGISGGERWSNDSFKWTYGEESITEGRALELLVDHNLYDNRDKKTDPNEKITLANGWTVQRENGFVTLTSCPIPGSRGGLFAQGKWVLRDQDNNGIDMDINLSTLSNRHPETRKKG